MNIKGNIPDIGKAYIMEIGKRLEKETEERKSADESLGKAIEAEEKARKAGDEALRKAIEAEEKARETGDKNLEKAIDTEAQAREAGDEALQKAIDAEEKARREGDEKLGEAVGAEEKTRKEEDEKIREEFQTALKEFGDSVIVDLVIRKAAWAKEGDIYIAKVPAPEASLARLPITVIWEKSFDIVKAAFMSSVAESKDGEIVFKAKKLPEADIYTTVAFLYPKEVIKNGDV